MVCVSRLNVMDLVGKKRRGGFRKVGEPIHSDMPSNTMAPIAHRVVQYDQAEHTEYDHQKLDETKNNHRFLSSDIHFVNLHLNHVLGQFFCKVHLL